MKKRLLISLTLGLGLLLGSWLAVVGMAQPVSSPPPPALEGPGFPPTTAGQPIGTPSAGVSINDVALSTVILGPIKDNTLYEPSGDVSSGAGGYLKAGIKCPDTRRRGVIAFDVAGSIPAGSTVVSATLQLSMTRRSCRYVPHPSISIHRLLADWGEGTSTAGDYCTGGAATAGDATWVHRFYSHTLWTTLGGDFDGLASATTDVSTPDFYEWGSTAETVADVQAWLDNPATNFGWLIRGEEVACTDPTIYTNTLTFYAAKEHPTEASRPVLIIEFLPPPLPALAVSKRVNDPTPHVRERITYTVVVANNGLGDAPGTQVSDALPPGLNFVGPVTLDPPGPGTLGAPPILGSGLFVAAGSSITLTFPVTVGKGLALGTQLINTVAVTSVDVPTPTTDAVVISISNPIAVDKTVDNASPAGRETITYTIAVANNGSIAATGVLVSDTLPVGIDFVGPVRLDPPGPGTLGDPPILGSDLFIAAGHGITLTIPVKLARGLALGTRLTNTVSVTSAEFPIPTTGAVVISYLPPPSIAHFNPSQDNTLYEHPTGDLSNGAGQHFFVGRNDLVESRRGVIAFDIASGIPAGSTVISATLRLNMSKTSSGPQLVALHRLLADWGEGTSDTLGAEGEGTDATLGDATWLHRFYDIDLWTIPGGDFVGTASAVMQVADAGIYEWGSTAGMVADVQAWVDNPSSNSGWLLVGNEGATHTTKRFDTREHPTEANRPVLIVAHVLPPELTVSKTVNNTAPHARERITYTIVVSNSGPLDANDVLISDPLPAGLNFAGPVVLDPPGPGTLGPPPMLGSGLYITSGHSIALTFPVTVARELAVGTQLTNTAAVTSARVSTPATGSVAISISSAMAVTKSVNNPRPFGGQTITYTITIANNGSIDATDVLVSDTLPPGISFVGPVVLDPPGPGTVEPPPILGSGLFIAAGHGITLTFPVTVARGLAVGTQLTNTVAVTSAEFPIPTTGVVTISISSIIVVDKMVSKAILLGDETITFTITVANRASIDVTDVLVSDTLPTGIGFLGPVVLDPPGPGTLGPPPILGSGLFITAGRGITLTFPVMVGEGLAAGTQLTNTVAVTSAQVSTPVIARVTVTLHGAVYLPTVLRNQ